MKRDEKGRFAKKDEEGLEIMIGLLFLKRMLTWGDYAYPYPTVYVILSHPMCDIIPTYLYVKLSHFNM